MRETNTLVQLLQALNDNMHLSYYTKMQALRNYLSIIDDDKFTRDLVVLGATNLQRYLLAAGLNAERQRRLSVYNAEQMI